MILRGQNKNGTCTALPWLLLLLNSILGEQPCHPFFVSLWFHSEKNSVSFCSQLDFRWLRVQNIMIIYILWPQKGSSYATTTTTRRTRFYEYAEYIVDLPPLVAMKIIVDWWWDLKRPGGWLYNKIKGEKEEKIVRKSCESTEARYNIIIRGPKNRGPIKGQYQWTLFPAADSTYKFTCDHKLYCGQRRGRHRQWWRGTRKPPLCVIKWSSNKPGILSISYSSSLSAIGQSATCWKCDNHEMLL